MSEKKIPEAIIRLEKGPVVNCPHCGAEWWGWGLDEAARTDRVETCQKCGKEFKVVKSKKH